VKTLSYSFVGLRLARCTLKVIEEAFLCTPAISGKCWEQLFPAESTVDVAWQHKASGGQPGWLLLINKCWKTRSKPKEEAKSSPCALLSSFNIDVRMDKQGLKPNLYPAAESHQGNNKSVIQTINLVVNNCMQSANSRCSSFTVMV